MNKPKRRSRISYSKYDLRPRHPGRPKGALSPFSGTYFWTESLREGMLHLNAEGCFMKATHI